MQTSYRYGIICAVMKMSFIPVIALCAAMLGGCFSMDVATNAALRDSELVENRSKPIEHVLISNYGWYLFNCIPIVCGDATPGAGFPWKFFSNHVDPVILHDRMMKHANEKNADVKSLVLSRDEQVFFDLPGSDIPCPIPFLVCYHEIQISGVLVERQVKAETPHGKEADR